MSSIQNTNPHIRPASPMIEDEPKSKRVKIEHQKTAEQETVEQKNIEQKTIEQVYQEIIAQPAALEDAALTKFEVDLIRAGNGEYLPAAKRLALFICKRQNSSAFSDAGEMMEKSNIFAGALLSMINEKAVAPTPAEIAPLYDKFLGVFDSMINETKRYDKSISLDTLSVRWHVDYGPDRELADVMSVWHKEIKQIREAAQGQKLPTGWGLGIKCSYIAESGCAKYADSVIDHDGSLLTEDPWETFYTSENPADEARAKSLEPAIPQIIKAKFEHRQIIRNMGYTLEKDAVALAKAGNWGLVNHLIKETKTPIPQAVGFALLQEAVCSQNVEACLILFKNGLPLCSAQEESTTPFFQKIINCLTPTKNAPPLNSAQEGSAAAFFQMIREWEARNINSILEAVELPKEAHNTFKDVIYHLALRYKDKQWSYEDTDMMANLRSKWLSAHFPDTRYYDINSTQRALCNGNFYKAFAQVLTQHGISIDSDEKIEEAIRKEAKTGKNDYIYQVKNEHIVSIEPLQDDGITNGKIVHAMNYTFEQHAEELSDAHNWGLVLHLIKNEPGTLNKKVAKRVLSSAYYGKQFEICKTIFTKGFPIYSKKVYRNSVFFDIVKNWDAKHIKNIIDLVKLRPENPQGFENVAFHISCRYRDRKMDALEQEVFNKLVDLGEKALGSKKAFYKAITHQLDDRKKTFKDAAFEKLLRELATE